MILETTCHPTSLKICSESHKFWQLVVGEFTKIVSNNRPQSADDDYDSFPRDFFPDSYATFFKKIGDELIIRLIISAMYKNDFDSWDDEEIEEFRKHRYVVSELIEQIAKIIGLTPFFF